VCRLKQSYFVVCIAIARELNLDFFFSLVHIPIRYINAFVKRIAFAQIFQGKIARGVVFGINRAPCFQPSWLRAVLFDQMQIQFKIS
jgi:hypothetical protein